MELIPKLKYTKEEYEKLQQAKIEKIVSDEEAKYFQNFGRISTKAERDDWFRCDPIHGPQLTSPGGW